MGGEFGTEYPRLPVTDPFKRVKYSTGLVLGVAEFEQEQAYFRERDLLHTRALHGCGTLSGLDVTVKGSWIVVSQGLAVDPKGNMIQVGPAQIADLNRWLAIPENLKAVRSNIRGRTASVYVLLRHTEAESDVVAVPSRPGQQPEQIPSRVLESFELKLSAEPHILPEDDAAQRLGDLFARIQISRSEENLTEAQMEGLVRAIYSNTHPEMVPQSGPLYVSPDRADAVIRAALRVWVTEARPRLAAMAAGSAPGEAPAASPADAPAEAWILLGRVDFLLTDDGQALQLEVSDENRPYLVDTRFLHDCMMRYAPFKEGLFSGGSGAGRGNAHSLVTITRVAATPQPRYELWFHMDPLGRPFGRIPTLGDVGLEVFGEHSHSPEGDLTLLPFTMRPSGRNLFVVELEQQAVSLERLRFVFRLGSIRLDDGIVLSEVAKDRGVHFEGEDQNAVVTVHYRQRAVAEVVASGFVQFDGQSQGYRLRAARQGEHVYLLTFPDFELQQHYMVKATLVGDFREQHAGISVVYEPGLTEGVLVHVHGINPDAQTGGFMVEITRTV